MGRGSVVAVLAACALACGGGPTGNVAPPATDGGTRTDSGVPDAGVADSGVPDAGQADAGIQDGGLPDGGGTDAGSPDAGALDAGTPDAGVPDAGTDGGVAADCRGLMPDALPPPVTARISGTREGSGYGYSCLAGTSDGAGNVLLGSQNEMQPHDTPMHFYSRNGTQIGAYTAVGYDALPQLSGYLGVEVYGGNYEHDVLALAPDGSVRFRGGDEHRAGIQAEDPLGGMIVWATQDLSADGDLQSFDADGKLRWSVPLHLGNFLETLGVDRRGNILLLWRHTNGDVPDGLDGQWVSHDGAPAGGPFNALRMGDFRPDAFALYPQVGSGLFLKLVDGDPARSAWMGAYPALKTTRQDAPFWLASHPMQTLHMIRGGRGYALLPPPAQTEFPCTDAIQVYSAQGTYCGSVALPISSGSCTSGSVSIGYDGTVLQRLPIDPTSCQGAEQCACDWHWWPGILG